MHIVDTYNSKEIICAVAVFEKGIVIINDQLTQSLIDVTDIGIPCTQGTKKDHLEFYFIASSFEEKFQKVLEILKASELSGKIYVISYYQWKLLWNSFLGTSKSHTPQIPKVSKPYNYSVIVKWFGEFGVIPLSKKQFTEAILF